LTGRSKIPIVPTSLDTGNARPSSERMNRSPEMTWQRQNRRGEDREERPANITRQSKIQLVDRDSPIHAFSPGLVWQPALVRMVLGPRRMRQLPINDPSPNRIRSPFSRRGGLRSLCQPVFSPRPPGGTCRSFRGTDQQRNHSPHSRLHYFQAGSPATPSLYDESRTMVNWGEGTGFSP